MKKKYAVIFGLAIASAVGAVLYLFELDNQIGPKENSGKLIESVSSFNFVDKVVKSDQLVLVDFWATWCVPCRMMAPVLASIARSHPEKVKIVKVDADTEKALSAQYEIQSLPTIVLFGEGKEIGRLTGYVPEEKILALIDQ